MAERPSTSGAARLDRSLSPTTKYSMDGTNAIAFLSLKALQNMEMFFLSTTEVPSGEVFICARENEKTVMYLCTILYSPLSISSLKFTILSIYKNYATKIQQIQIPQQYKTISAVKFVIFTNQEVAEEDAMFIKSTETLFNTTNGKVFSFNQNVFSNKKIAFGDFLKSTLLYANQDHLLLNILNCMKEFVGQPVLEEAGKNYVNYIYNWKSLPEILDFIYVKDLMEFSILLRCALPIKFDPAHIKVTSGLLWEAIKKFCPCLKRKHLLYLTAMITKDSYDLELCPDDSFTLQVLTGKCSIDDVAEKYIYKCFTNNLPIILEEKQYLNLKRLPFKCISIVDDAECPENLLEIAESALCEEIFLNCGRKVALHEITNESLLRKLSVSDMIDAIKYKPDIQIPKRINSNVKNHTLFERRVRSILLKKEVLDYLVNECSNDLFVINISNLDKESVISFMNINEADVCSANDYEEPFKYVIVTKNCEYKIIRKSRNVHFVEVINANSNVIKWIGTHGRVDRIKRFKEESEDHYFHLNNIHVHLEKQQVLIISGAAGIGKTTALQQIALSAPPNVWVIFVDLKSECDYFQNCSGDALEHLRHFCPKADNDVLREIFSTKLRSKEILLLLDGYNEVLPTHGEAVIKVIKEIQSGGFKIIITTRGPEIEDLFGTFCISLCGFNDAEQETFVKTYFDYEIPKFTQSYEVIREIIDSIDLQNNNKFCSLPLNIALIADVLSGYRLTPECKYCKSHCSTRKITVNFNLFTLHEEFVNKHMKNAPIESHENLAIKLMFNHLPSYSLVKESIELKVFESDLFSHRTFVEYFAAKWLAKNRETSFADEILRTEIYKNDTLKLFFDLIANAGCEIHELILFKKFAIARKMIEDDAGLIYRVNNFNHTLLHTLISTCNKKESFDIDLVNIVHILYASYDIDKIKDYFPTIVEETTQQYDNVIVVRDHFYLNYNEPLNIIELLFTNKITISELLNIKAINLELLHKLVDKGEIYDFNLNLGRFVDEFGNNLFHWAAINNYRKLLYFKTSDKWLEWLTARNNNGDTPILLAIKWGHFESVEILIKYYRMSQKDANIAFIYALLGKHEAIIVLLLEFHNFDDYLVDYIAEKHNFLLLLLNKTEREINKASYLLNAASYNNTFIIESVIKLLNNLNVSVSDESVLTLLLNAVEEGTMEALHFITYYYNNKENFKQFNLDSLKIAINKRTILEQTPLNLSVIQGNYETVEFLISNEADVNCEDNIGWTPLLYAVQNEYEKIVELLCKKNAPTSTALNLAAKTGNLRIIKCLLLYGASLNYDCLHAAAENGDVNIMRYLCRYIPIKCEAADTNGTTLMHIAAKSNHTKLINYLISHKMDVNVKDKFGATPLHYAKLEALKILLANNAKNCKDNEGSTLMHYAAKRGATDIIELFPEDTNVKNNLGQTPLQFACNLQVAKLLFANGADARHTDFDGRTNLHHAVKNGCTDVVKYLLEFTDDVNARDCFGATPLHYAAQEEIKLLISLGADVQSRDRLGLTPLHYAVQSGLEDVDFLISRKGEMQFIDEKELTPLYYAAQRGLKYVNRLICELGEDVHSMNRKPLHYFAWRKLTKREFRQSHYTARQGLKNVELLLSQGAYVQSWVHKGLRPLYYAAQQGLEDIELLISIRADVQSEDCEGLRPLHYAAQRGLKDVTDLMYELRKEFTLLHAQRGLKDAGQSDDYLRSRKLHDTAWDGLKNVELLLSQLAYMSWIHKELRPLYYAADQGLEDIELLISIRADVQSKDCEGLTPLHYAAQRGLKDVKDLMYELQEDVHSMNRKGSTRLHYSAQRGLKDAGQSYDYQGFRQLHDNAWEGFKNVQLLLRQGAHVQSWVHKGLTPSHYGAQRGLEEVELLISLGAYVDFTDYRILTPLHYAAQLGLKHVVQLLISLGADVKLRDRKGLTPLHYAAQRGLEIVELLISQGADVQSRDRIGSTCLHYAAKAGIRNVIEYLIKFIDVNIKNMIEATPLHYTNNFNCYTFLVEKGADLRSIDINSSTCLHYAAKSGCSKILSLLINQDKYFLTHKDIQGRTFLHLVAKHFEDPNALEELGVNLPADITDDDDALPLHYAAQGKLEMFKFFAKITNNLSDADCYGNNCLHYASKIGNIDIVKFFISLFKNKDAKHCINVRNNDGEFPIYLAMNNNHLEIVELLLINFPDEKRYKNEFGWKSNRYTLNLAIKRGLSKTIEFLSRLGCTTNSLGETAMHIALKTQEAKMINSLQFANLNAEDNFGRTPLHLAAEFGSLACVKLLLRSGGDAKIVDHANSSCAHYAAKNDKNPDTLRYLLSLKSPKVANKFGATPLHYAKLATAKVLIEHFGANPSAVDNEGHTALHYMAKTGSREVIKYLALCGEDVNARNRFDATPLHHATWQYSSFKVLIENGAVTSLEDDEEFSTLHYAAKAGNVAVIDYLLPSIDINLKNCFGATPLHNAIIGGRLYAVKFLIDKGAQLTVDNDESACLHYAAKAGFENILRFLLPKFDINITNSFGHTPLHVAASSGHLEIVKLLVKSGSKSNLIDSNGLTSLHYAAKAGHTTLIRYLTSLDGCDVDARSNLDVTPLHYSVGDLLNVKILIQKKGDVMLVDCAGFTSLHYAAKAGAVDTTKFLLETGLDVNVKNNFGATPLHYAANSDTAQLLLEKQADPNIVDRNAATCLHYAAKSGFISVIDCLVPHINVNKRDGFGATALHVAVETGNLEAVRKLIELGADANAKDKSGLTCIEFAANLGHIDIINFFMESKNIQNANNLSALQFAVETKSKLLMRR